MILISIFLQIYSEFTSKKKKKYSNLEAIN